MTANSTFNRQTRHAALLWDESFLWGIMARKALIANGLGFDLIRSRDVRSGKLREYSLLFVPGGWASNKMKALGESGVEEIRRFVWEGGAYLGFCGGAGLATMDGIGLLPVKRRPTSERVPSFSGPIKLVVSDHELWTRIKEPVFHAWWPSQFVVDGSVTILAAYGSAMPESFSADVNVGDAETNGSWAELERIYQINLDPGRLTGEPAVIEGKFGEGRVVLSLVHFDTPDDGNGATAFKNLWSYLGGERVDHIAHQPCVVGEESERGNTGFLGEIETAVEELISLGERNFLWFWKNPMLLQWRRGVRGLEYCTLHIMVKELVHFFKNGTPDLAVPDIETKLSSVREFVDKAKRLLVRERYAIQNTHITYERCSDPEIQALREELFSRSKSHGGLFKEMIDQIDSLLYEAMTRRP